MIIFIICFLYTSGCKHRVVPQHCVLYNHIWMLVCGSDYVCVYLWASFHVHPVSLLRVGCLMKFETRKSRHNLLCNPSVINKQRSWKYSATIWTGEELQDTHSHRHTHMCTESSFYSFTQTDMSIHSYHIHSQWNKSIPTHTHSIPKCVHTVINIHLYTHKHKHTHTNRWSYCRGPLETLNMVFSSSPLFSLSFTY